MVAVSHFFISLIVLQKTLLARICLVLPFWHYCMTKVGFYLLEELNQSRQQKHKKKQFQSLFRVFSLSLPAHTRRQHVSSGGYKGPEGASGLGLFVGSRTDPSYMTLFLMPSWSILCCTRILALFIRQ